MTKGRKKKESIMIDIEISIPVPTSDITEGVNDASQATPASLYAKGETIKTWCGYGCWHYGISDGADGAIHSSKRHDRKVTFTTLMKFSDGREVSKSPDITSDDLTAAYQKAEARIGEPYNVLDNNCEHFVREVHGLPSETPQLQEAVCFIASITAITTNNPVLRHVAWCAVAGGALNKKNPATGALVGMAIAVGVIALLSKSKSNNSNLSDSN